MSPLSRRLLMVWATALLVVVTPAHARNEKDWATASDIGSYGLAALALGIPAIRGDGKGVLQAGGSIVAGQLVSRGLKEAFPTLRPDGSDRASFPSGHATQSFAAATTLYRRQGAKMGIPAFVVASFVGIARVQADKHRWHEVLVGAGIGTAAGFLITNKPDSNTALLPWSDGKGGGLTVAMRF